MKDPIIEVIRNKKGIVATASSEVQELSYKEMTELRQQLCLAIGTMEELWQKKNALPDHG